MHEVFGTVAIYSKVRPTNTEKHEQDEIIGGYICQKVVVKVFQQWSRLQCSCF